MEKQKGISRHLFIRFLSIICVLFGVWIWRRIALFQKNRENCKEFRHGKDLPLGISYFGSYYLIRSENSIRAFSTKCTHAGCRLMKGDGTSLQCGCHGSSFNGINGHPIKGPAFQPLTEFGCTFDSSTGEWVVKV